MGVCSQLGTSERVNPINPRDLGMPRGTLRTQFPEVPAFFSFPEVPATIPRGPRKSMFYVIILHFL